MNLLFLLLIIFSFSCDVGSERNLGAFQVENRADLIGGPSAVGNMGDYIIQNNMIRALIQTGGLSRAFGLFGGNLIDADRVRPNTFGDSSGGGGLDSFIEMFPLFFLSGADIQSVEIANDGSDGNPAIVRAKGMGKGFVAMLWLVEQLIQPQRLEYTIDYILAANKPYIQIDTTIKNTSQDTFVAKIPAFNFPAAMGQIVMMGKRNRVFVPGIAGYSIYYSLVDLWANPYPSPAFTGLIGDFLVGVGDYVSYGLIPAASEENYVWKNRDLFGVKGETIRQTSVLLPIEASSITGFLHTLVPDQIAPGESCTTTLYYVIGDGSVSSIRDIYMELNNLPYGTISGHIFEELTKEPVEHARVMAINEKGEYYTEFKADKKGRFKGRVEPGLYTLVSRTDNHYLSQVYGPLEVTADNNTFIQMEHPISGYFAYEAFDDSNRRIPARVSVIGYYPPEYAGKNPRHFLYNMNIGELRQTIDMIPDDPNDPNTLTYLETVLPTYGGDVTWLRPGFYKVVASRGMEYELDIREIEIRKNELTQVSFQLKHSVPTPNMLSGDYHTHSGNSYDSAISFEDRLLSFAADGVDLAISTDHNVVSDFKPMLEKLYLEDFLNTFIGLELTTFENGHFNAYTLKYDKVSYVHGSPEWFLKTPTEDFTNMRNLGNLGSAETLLQVNHPRDSIMGYYKQYNIDPETAVESPTYPSQFFYPLREADFGMGKYDPNYDVLELMNSKRYDLNFHLRVPPELVGIVPGAEEGMLIKENGFVSSPGAIDDWFNMLNLGHKYIGVGTSDSHSKWSEPGLPRSYFVTGFDTPKDVTDEYLREMTLSQKSFTTTGPIIELTVDGQSGDTAMGQTYAIPSGEVKLHIVVKSASWISANLVTIYGNGQLLEQIEISDSNEIVKFDAIRTFQITRDTWFVVSVVGHKTLWPAIAPIDEPPVDFNTVLSVFADIFGGGTDTKKNCLQPATTYPALPFAITNPVWIKLYSNVDFSPATDLVKKVDVLVDFKQCTQDQVQKYLMLNKNRGIFEVPAYQYE